MTFQKRLKRIMKQRGWRVADLARALGEPYTTVREWVLHARFPAIDKWDDLDRVLMMLENGA
jgi:hypothetical protein